MIYYYHNPKCSKSRAGLAYLDEVGIEAEIKLYLEDGISADEASELTKKIDGPIESLIRTDTAKTLGIDTQQLDARTVHHLLSHHPELLQRPILVTETQARIGRPTENLKP